MAYLGNDEVFTLPHLENEGIISSKELPELRDLLKKIVKHPLLARYFSKDVAFENENEILHAKATRYKPDRIVFDGTRVVLLNFKAPPLVQKHIDNLNYYASPFRDLLYAEIKCVLYYFDEEEVEQWVYAEELKVDI